MEAKVTTLETEHANKDDEHNALQERAKLLEEQLEEAQVSLKEASEK